MNQAVPSPPSDALSDTEATYLIGSVFHDACRKAKLFAGTLRAYRLVSLYRSRGEIIREDAWRAAGLNSIRALDDIICRFDERYSAQRLRYSIGRVLLEGRGFWVSVAGLLLDLASGRLNATRMQSRLAMTRRSAPIAVKNVGLSLEAWDDDFDRPKSSVANRSKKSDPADYELEAFDFDEEPKSVRGADLAQKIRLEIWLCSLGSINSGVNIEPVVGSLVDAVPAGCAADCLSAVDDDDTLKALDVMAAGLSKARLPDSVRARFARLHAIVALVGRGFDLPERSDQRAYDPVPNRTLCLFHMRFPFEANGYVTRSQLILSSLRAAQLEPVAVTRLGYPQDLGRHRAVKIEPVTVIDGINYHALMDDQGGLHGRGLDRYIYEYAARVETLAREIRPAILHAASNYINGLAAIIAGRRLGIPVLYEVRGIWEITQASLRAGYGETLRFRQEREMENLAVHEADQIACISNQLSQFIVDHGADPDKITVVPNGVDLAEHHVRPAAPNGRKKLGLPEHAFVVGYIGSVVHYEGIDLIVGAIARLRGAVRPVHFLLVGEGARLDAIREAAKQLGVENLCHFVGRKSREEVEQIYSVVDVVALPRRSLPVTEIVPPLKPFEAMAHAKPVIVSDVAAIADTVINEETGIIVKTGDVGSLADALTRLVEDDGLCARLGARGLEWVTENRTADSLGQQLSKAYQKAGIIWG